MCTQPLHLSVRTQPEMPAGLHDFLQLFCMEEVGILIGSVELSALPLVQLVMRRKKPQSFDLIDNCRGLGGFSSEISRNR